MQRGISDKEGLCGIAMEPSYPIKEEEMIYAMELKMKPVLLNLTNRVQLVEYIIYWQYYGKL
jgi:hypothetical protein